MVQHQSMKFTVSRHISRFKSEEKQHFFLRSFKVSWPSNIYHLYCNLLLSSTFCVTSISKVRPNKRSLNVVSVETGTSFSKYNMGFQISHCLVCCGLFQSAGLVNSQIQLVTQATNGFIIRHWYQEKLDGSQRKTCFLL